MATDKETFTRQVRRRVDCCIRAITDGCVECTESGGACREHASLITGLILEPSKHLPIAEKEIFDEIPQLHNQTH